MPVVINIINRAEAAEKRIAELEAKLYRRENGITCGPKCHVNAKGFIDHVVPCHYLGPMEES